MKILLWGASGQLGWELARSLAVLGEVIAPARGKDGVRIASDAQDARATSGTQGVRGEGDAKLQAGVEPDGALCGELTDLDGLAATVRHVRPGLVVNAAAYTAVDRAETDAHLAHRVNALAPGALAAAAHEVGAWIVHYSTDYVFDGSGTRPWRETDPTGPLNVYGRTKLEGEKLVARHCARHLILRTSWVHGAHGQNFARTMLRLAGERERLSVVDDQFGAPTGADLLADVTAHAVVAARAAPGKAGLYHVAAAGETSWNGYARFVLAQARAAGRPLKAGPEAVEAVPSSAFQTAARRPHNSRLDTARLAGAFGLHLPHWQTGVARMLAELP
jgi:dTDP-4-dehydrorhamnose reductase